MFRSPTRIVLVIATLGLLTLGASWWDRAREARSAVATAEVMRVELTRLRGEVDACLAVREQAELRFEGFDRRTREMRAQVDSFEALDPRGVPSEVYDEYLARVDAFNDATTGWERESEGLRRFAAQCDSLVEQHNGQVAAIRSFMVEAGVWEEAWLTGASDVGDGPLEGDVNPAGAFDDEGGPDRPPDGPGGADEGAGTP